MIITNSIKNKRKNLEICTKMVQPLLNKLLQELIVFNRETNLFKEQKQKNFTPSKNQFQKRKRKSANMLI